MTSNVRSPRDDEEELSDLHVSQDENSVDGLSLLETS